MQQALRRAPLNPFRLRTPFRRKSALVVAGRMRSMRINASRSLPLSSFSTRSLPKGTVGWQDGPSS